MIVVVIDTPIRDFFLRLGKFKVGTQLCIV